MSLLDDIFSSAVTDELIAANPMAGVERPKLPRGRWKDTILEPREIARVARAFTDEHVRWSS
jgi:hypothetical protein